MKLFYSSFFSISYDFEFCVYYEHTYFYLIQLIILTTTLSTIMLVISYLLSDKNLYYEKISGYECGFDPFSDAREPFSIKFYLISILFILFDIELIYFFPWVAIIKASHAFSVFFTMYVFFILLVIGFYYEWKKESITFE